MGGDQQPGRKGDERGPLERAARVERQDLTRKGRRSPRASSVSRCKEKETRTTFRSKKRTCERKNYGNLDLHTRTDVSPGRIEPRELSAQKGGKGQHPKGRS